MEAYLVAEVVVQLEGEEAQRGEEEVLLAKAASL